MRLFCSLFFAFLFCQFGFFKAFSEEEVIPLEEVSVYGARASSLFELPVMSSKIQLQAPGSTLAGDMAHLLEITPGVSILGSPRKSGQDISIRGFDSDSIVLLIDGRRQIFESEHDGVIFVDPSLLKSVEVVRGSISALYGSGGIGGVVAFKTKDAKDFLTDGKQQGGAFSLLYRHVNKAYAPALTFYGRHFYGQHLLDIIGHVAHHSSGVIQQGDGNSLQSKDNGNSALLKASFLLYNLHLFEGQFQFYRNTAQEPNNGANTRLGTRNPIVNKQTNDTQWSMKYAFDDFANKVFKPKVHVYYKSTGVEETDTLAEGINAATQVQLRHMKTYGFHMDNQARLKIQKLDYILTIGVDILKNSQLGSNSMETDNSRGGVPNAEVVHKGFYFQKELKSATTAKRKFSLILGGRMDTYKSYNSSKSKEKKSQGFSPKISLTYWPSKIIMLFGSWSSAFRAPSLTETFASGVHFPEEDEGRVVIVNGRVVFNHFLPNTDLASEKLTNFEVGAGLNLTHLLLPKDRLTIKGVWFKGKGSNLINQKITRSKLPTQSTTQFINVSNATITGFELETHYQTQRFNLKVGASYVKVTDKKTGEFLSGNVPLTILIEGRYRLWDSMMIGWRARKIADNDRVIKNLTPTDGYLVQDIYFRWTFQQEVVAEFGIENLANVAYKKSSISFIEEGRSYSFRLRYTW